jgi:hypothetical protein
VCGDSQDPDPSAGVLDHRTYMQPAAGQCDGLEEVACKEGVGLRVQNSVQVVVERCGTGSIPVVRRICQTVEDAILMAW